MLSFSVNDQGDVIKAINSTNMDVLYLEQMISLIYPTELCDCWQFSTFYILPADPSPFCIPVTGQCKIIQHSKFDPNIIIYYVVQEL